MVEEEAAAAAEDEEDEEEAPPELLFELLLLLAPPLPLEESATPAKDPALDRAARRPLPGFAAMNAAAMFAMIIRCFATVLVSKQTSESSTGGVMA